MGMCGCSVYKHFLIKLSLYKNINVKKFIKLFKRIVSRETLKHN